MDRSHPLIWGFCQEEDEKEDNPEPNTNKYHVVPVIIITALMLLLGLSQIILVHSSGISGALKTIGYGINNSITASEFYPAFAIVIALFLLFVYALVSDVVLGLY